MFITLENYHLETFSSNYELILFQRKATFAVIYLFTCDPQLTTAGGKKRRRRRDDITSEFMYGVMIMIICCL